MARMLVTLDGRTEASGTPLLMHNDRLADPLDSFALEIKKLSNKRNKTEENHLAMALLEFQGGLYHDGVVDPTDISVGEIGPYIPGWHVVRSIQNAGKAHKLGATVLRGVTPVTLKAPLQYEGPRDPESLWRENFWLRKSVGVGQARVPRTRPMFEEWRLEVEIEVDLTQLDPEKVNQLALEAGKFYAIGDYRPLYGRFFGSARLLNEPELEVSASNSKKVASAASA